MFRYWLAMERAIAEAIGWCIVELDPSARDLDGNVLAERFSFAETGLIGDYENENEASWTFEPGILKIFKRNGDLIWTSAAIDRIDPDGWRIRLGTHLNPELDLYLTQTGPRSDKPATPRLHRYTAKKRVLLLANGLDIEKRLGDLLADAEIVRISRVSEIEDHSDCNVFISGFTLTHAAQPQDASAFVARITSRFAL